MLRLPAKAHRLTRSPAPATKTQTHSTTRTSTATTCTMNRYSTYWRRYYPCYRRYYPHPSIPSFLSLTVAYPVESLCQCTSIDKESHIHMNMLLMLFLSSVLGKDAARAGLDLSPIGHLHGTRRGIHQLIFLANSKLISSDFSIKATF